jgi:hypothetical protein
MACSSRKAARWAVDPRAAAKPLFRKDYAMRFYHVLVIFAVTSTGACEEETFALKADPEVAIDICADHAKTDRCTRDEPYRAAYCYDEGVIGPQPFISGRDRAYFDCSAPDEFNIIGPAPFYWRNYWCCGTRGCVPGTETECTCFTGSKGTAYCGGDAINVEDCFCPDDQPASP